MVYCQIGYEDGHAAPGVTLGVWAQRVEALLVDGRALAFQQRHNWILAQRLLDNHFQILHAPDELITQTRARAMGTVSSCQSEGMTYLTAQSLLHQRLLGQLVQGEGHGRRACLNARHFEAGRLGGQKVLMVRKVCLVLLKIGLLLEREQHFNEIIAQIAAPFTLVDHQLDDTAQEFGVRLRKQLAPQQRYQLGQKEYHKEVYYTAHIRPKYVLTM